MRYISPGLLNPMDSSQSSRIMSPMPSITTNLSLSPPLHDSVDGGGDIETAWYGNIQYLLNISAVGALTCVLVFLLVKLRSDHRRMPGPCAIASKLLAVWHATGREIARHCGANAAQFLLIEGVSCVLLLATAILSLCVMLPVNLYSGSAPMDDQFSKTTVNRIALWIHFVFVIIVVVLVHFEDDQEEIVYIIRFRDGYGNPSDHSANLTAIFTIMVHGVLKTLGFDKTALVEYFQRKYPGKIYRVIVPMDLCALNDLIEDGEYGEQSSRGVWNRACLLWRRVRYYWDQILGELGFTDEEKLRKLQELRADLVTEMAAYKEERAKGAGVAFVVFKDASPLAVISAIKSAGHIINAEAMDNAQIWLAWLAKSCPFEDGVFLSRKSHSPKGFGRILARGHNLKNGTSPVPKQTFGFAQYYAFNLTIFALTMMYSSFAPLVVPVGAIYFGYGYVVDKYNFLFVYRVQGFPAGNDGRLMDTKLLPSDDDSFQTALLQGIQTVDNVIDGPIDYEATPPIQAYTGTDFSSITSPIRAYCAFLDEEVVC
ncbi:early-responsive to dehydration stress protein [Actinidia rufa]|uniref:Early-responsive to dehydration stress protein n=1 Tax=Actinidia rufa TaxID=165716 RepID=A0A7J0DIH1_9ERIC|nr:early-responsive to dehydration stress protein [Actinidia rufa]